MPAPAGKAPADHGHGHESAPIDWWAIFDALVWIAVGLIVVLGAEWLFGKVIRERIASQAQQFLARREQPEATDTPTE